jgi:ABC-type antimicrobial peptide transport system permease subunit
MITSMEVLVLILLVLGLACFLVEAFAPAAPARPRMLPLGLAFWITTVIIGVAQGIGAD